MTVLVALVLALGVIVCADDQCAQDGEHAQCERQQVQQGIDDGQGGENNPPGYQPPLPSPSETP
jgi:hypothetical protein